MANAASFEASAFAGTSLQDSEGFLTGAAVFPIVLFAAALILLALSLTRCRRSAAWLALGLVAQAASHQLADAAPTVSYQHYPPIERLFDKGGWMFAAALGVQTLLVMFGMAKAWPRMRGALAPFPAWKIAVTIVAASLMSATFSRRPGDYAFELALASLVQLSALCNIALVVMSLPHDVAGRIGARLEKLLGGSPDADRAEPGGVDRFAVVLALGVTAVALLLSVFSYGRHPHVPDEVIYLLHAGYFADGALYLTPPPARAAFDVDLMLMTKDKWFSPVAPGWPAALALGSLVGAPWAVNAVLAGLSVLLAYVFLRELYSRSTARVALLLLCASPWFLFMGMNFMTHMLTLALTLAAATAVARLVRTGRVAWGWAGGAATGALSLVRPLEGLAVACLLGLWTLKTRGRFRRFAAVSSLVVSCGAMAALVLPYNRALTGSATTFPMSQYIAKYYAAGANDLGFGTNRGLGWRGLDPIPGHGLTDAVINTGLNAFSVNIELLGWATGSVVLMIAFLVSGRLRRSDYMMLASIASIIAIHTLYWFSGGPDFGARYWFLILVPCLALTARAIESLPHIDGTRSEWSNPRAARLFGAALTLSAMALITFVPWRAVEKYHHYRAMRPGIQTLAREHAFGKSLVLVRGLRHPDFASAAVYNPSIPDGNEPIYAWARTPEIAAEARAAFPDRPVWVVNGPSITGRGFEIGGQVEADAKAR